MSASPPPLKKSRRGCLVAGLVVLLLGALTLGGLWWWQNRPIKPVELTAQEKTVVEAKVEALQLGEPSYEPGVKEIILTERELNGLLNEHTQLGEKLKLELARDAVHARIEMDLDPDLPVAGGKKLKARARFVVASPDGRPTLVLEDLTVWGVSLPNDWLGGLKGRDLLGEALGQSGTGLAGVEELKVEPGRLVIRLAE